MYWWFLALVFSIPNVVAQCPSGSVLWSPLSTCYFFMSTAQNFADAETSCNNLGGNLASIHDAFTNAFLFTQSQSAFSPPSNFWIGLSCNAGNCSWTDGSPFSYNDFTNSSNLNDCGTMNLSNGGWVVENCATQKYCVCERAETLVTTTKTSETTTTSDALCPTSDWYYFNETNSCYYWTNVMPDWATAEAFCVSQGADLTSIHSSNEQNFLSFIHNDYVWTGLHANSGPIELNTVWRWTDGSDTDFLPWDGIYNFPNVGDNYQCVVAKRNAFTNIQCDPNYYNYTGICKTRSSKIVSTINPPPLPKCPDGWTYYPKTTSCYLGPTQNMTQSVAENYCISQGGHLSSIHSNDELSFLMYATSYQTFWIGLFTTVNPIEINTTWYWNDNTYVDYIAWIDGIPSLDNKLCTISATKDVSKRNSTKIYAFQNEDCSVYFPAICKQPPFYSLSTSSPASTTTPEPPSPCDNVYTFYNYFIPYAKMNWTTAESYCKFCGGHLTSIHSYDELFYNIVRSIYKFGPFKNSDGIDNYWIGLYSDNEGRKWQWNDGTSYDYAYWMSGYPMHNASSCGNLDFDDTGSAMANNKNCSTSHYAVCKY
uniref:C-type lectin domain-containing protein n=1 Tax=Panagrolaimus sp. ES5 TaxID=591445 RepID=A0AC34FPR2_9BILA